MMVQQSETPKILTYFTTSVAATMYRASPLLQLMSFVFYTSFRVGNVNVDGFQQYLEWTFYATRITCKSSSFSLFRLSDLFSRGAIFSSANCLTVANLAKSIAWRISFKSNDKRIETTETLVDSILTMISAANDSIVHDVSSKESQKQTYSLYFTRLNDFKQKISGVIWVTLTEALIE